MIGSRGDTPQERDMGIDDAELVRDVEQEPRIGEIAVELGPIALARTEFELAQKSRAGVGEGVDARSRAATFDALPDPLRLRLFDQTMIGQGLEITEHTIDAEEALELPGMHEAVFVEVTKDIDMALRVRQPEAKRQLRLLPDLRRCGGFHLVIVPAAPMGLR
jgi:hypothetical protein